jgi:hypothetical protein
VCPSPQFTLVPRLECARLFVFTLFSLDTAHSVSCVTKYLYYKTQTVILSSESFIWHGYSGRYTVDFSLHNRSYRAILPSVENFAKPERLRIHGWRDHLAYISFKIYVLFRKTVAISIHRDIYCYDCIPNSHVPLVSVRHVALILLSYIICILQALAPHKKQACLWHHGSPLDGFVGDWEHLWSILLD